MEFFFKKSNQSIIIQIFPIMWSILVNFSIGEYSNTSTNVNCVWVGVALLLLIAYCAYIKKCIKFDLDADTVKKENKQFKQILVSQMTTYARCAKAFHIFSKSIKTDGEIELNHWNFEHEMNFLCQDILSLMSKIGTSNGQFIVSYVKKNDNKNSIVTISSALTQGALSNIHKQRTISNEGHYDAKIFKKNLTEPIVLFGEEEINQNFTFNPNEEKKQYTQYLAFPVIFDNSDFIGLFQIVSLNGTKIGETAEQVKEINNKYISVYAKLAVLMYKTESVITAIPDKK